MTRSQIALATLAATCLAGTATSRAEAPPCPAAHGSLAKGDATAAEKSARECLAARPGDAQVWLVLARSLAAQKRYDEALRWIDRGLVRYPNDLDLAAWKARVLAWRGNHDGAWSILQRLPAKAFRDRDTAQLAADVAFWRGDDREALRRLTALESLGALDQRLQRNRAIAYARLGDHQRSRAILRRLCRAGDNGACALLASSLRRHGRAMVAARAGYALANSRADGMVAELELRYRLRPRLQLWSTAELRRRDFGTGVLTDAHLRLGAHYQLAQRWSIELAMGATPGAEFLPTWAGWAELGFRASNRLELRARYWRMEFEAGSADIASAALLYELGDWLAYARYYLASRAGDELGHSVIATLTRAIGWRWRGTIGIGAGTQNDYLVPRADEVDSFVLGLAGLSWQLTPAQRIRADLIVRRERAGGRTDLESQLTIGLGLLF